MPYIRAYLALWVNRDREEKPNVIELASWRYPVIRFRFIDPDKPAAPHFFDLKPHYRTN